MGFGMLGSHGLPDGRCCLLGNSDGGLTIRYHV